MNSSASIPERSLWHHAISSSQSNGFWQACVRMVTQGQQTELGPKMTDRPDSSSAPEHTSWATEFHNSTGDLRPPFCDWFDCYCCYDASIEVDLFFRLTLGQPNSPELLQNQTEVINSETPAPRSAPSAARQPSQQLQTKFACVVIEQMNPPLRRESERNLP